MVLFPGCWWWGWSVCVCVCVYGLKRGWTGNRVCGLNDWTISSILETWVGLQECPLPNMIFPASLLASGWSLDHYTNWIVATSWGLFGIDNTDICGYRYLWMEREKENTEGQMLLWHSLYFTCSAWVNHLFCPSPFACSYWGVFSPGRYLYTNSRKRVNNNSHSPPHKSNTENIPKHTLLKLKA